MAIIESFRIHGLAGRPHPVERTLTPGTNVFWATNGGGKTSLLKILHAALINETRTLHRVPFSGAEVLIRSGNTLLKRKYSRAEESGPIEVDEEEGTPYLLDDADSPWRDEDARDFAWETEFISQDRVAPLHRGRIRHTYLPISRLTQMSTDFVLRQHHMGRLHDETLDDAFADQVNRVWRTYTASVLAKTQAVQQQGLASILATLFGGVYGSDTTPRGSIGDPEEGWTVVNEFLTQQNILLKEGREGFIQRYSADSVLQEIVGRIEGVRDQVAEIGKPHHTLQSIIEELYSGHKHLEMKATGSAPRARSLTVEVATEQIPLQSLSSGEKQLLQLLLEVLSAGATAVLIDEPELSMHVDWQLRLIDSMNRINPDCQLILATHSPEIVGTAPTSGLFEL